MNSPHAHLPNVVHVGCAHCGAANRVPTPRLQEDPTCGRCGAGLLDGRPVELTTGSFERFLSQTELPVLVDFWAPWCGPCRTMAPAFEQAAAQLKGQAILAKVDTEAHPELARRFAIRSIPTLIRFQKAHEMRRASGALPAAQIVAMGR